MAKFEYRVLEEYGTIGQSGAVLKKVRLVSFNGGPPRLDIRQWRQKQDGTEVIFKGISLSGEELAKLKEIIRDLELEE